MSINLTSLLLAFIALAFSMPVKSADKFNSPETKITDTKRDLVGSWTPIKNEIIEEKQSIERFYIATATFGAAAKEKHLELLKIDGLWYIAKIKPIQHETKNHRLPFYLAILSILQLQ